MYLFFIILVLIFIVDIITKPQKNANRRYVIIMFSIFAVLMMFKHPSVGNDTHDYINLFNVIRDKQNLDAFLNSSRYENGYVYLNYYLAKISTDPQILFIVTGAFVAFSFGRFIYKYSDIPWMSTLMFFTLQFYDLSMSGLRQIVSISILLFAYDFMIDRKFWRFLAIVLIANLIHGSAILFLVLYPLTAKKRYGLFYFASVVIAGGSFIGFNFIIRIVAIFFPQYVNYLQNDGFSYSTTPTLAVTLMLLLWLILFLIAKLYERKYKEGTAEEISLENRKIYINSVHEVAVWLGVIMLFMALHGTILNRFKYVFSVPIIVYYPNMLNNIKELHDIKNQRLYVYVSCIVFIVYILIIYTYRPGWQTTYPYTFYWLEPSGG